MHSSQLLQVGFLEILQEQECLVTIRLLHISLNPTFSSSFRCAVTFWYLLFFVQMKDVYKRRNGGTAMGTLEGQLAGGQGRNQATAFISA